MSNRITRRRPPARRRQAVANALQPLESRRLMTGSGSSAWDWSMPARFGDQLDSAGLPVIPNTRDYVFPNPTTVGGHVVARYPVKLQSTGSGGASYAWNLQGQSIDYSETIAGKAPTIDLPEGKYQTTLTVTKADGSVVSSTGTVSVHNLLYVAIGDSYSSGEGNPHVAQQYNGAGYTTAGAQWARGADAELDRLHRMTHRSAKAGTAQAALAMENSDPKTSVTFVFLSHTGSTIDVGLLHQRETGEPGEPGYVPAQLDRLAELVGDQHIDGLTLSIGGNDIGFADILVDLLDADALADPITYESDLNDIFDAAATKITTLGNAWYPQLNEQLRSRFDVGQVFLTEYPDITKDTSGNFANELLGDVLPGLEVNNHELKLMAWRAMIPLSNTMRDAAASLGWTFVDGIAAGTGNGGYGVNLRTAMDSVYMQGPLGSYEDMLTPGLATLRLANTKGTMHPIGHALDVQRDMLLQKMNAADLQVSAFDVGSGAFTPAANGGTYAFTVRNGAMAGTSAATTAQLQLSLDDDVWNDLPILSFDVPELDAGESITFTGTLPVFSDPLRPAGNTYWLAPVVDPSESLAESNEANNSGTNSGLMFQTRVDKDLMPIYGAGDATIDPTDAPIGSRNAPRNGVTHGVLGLDEAIGARDLDAYKFTVAAGQRIDFALTNDLTLRIFRVTPSPAGGYVLASDTPVGSTTSGSLRQTFAIGGTYVAVVGGAANANASPATLAGRVPGPQTGYDLRLLDTTPTVWDGGAGTMRWNDARNWSRDVLPAAGDEVLVNLPAGQTVIVDGAALAGQLTSTAGLAIANGGTLNVADAATLSSLAIFYGGTLDGGGTIAVNGALTWAGGSMVGSGRTIARGTTTLGVAGGNADEFIGGSRTLRVEGTASVTATAGNWGLQATTASARVEVAAGRVFILNDAASLYGVPATLVVESGAYLEHTGTDTSTITWAADIAGNLYVPAGTINLLGTTTVAANGSVQPELNATIGFGGATTINGSVSGAGTLTINGGTTDFNGRVGRVNTFAFANGTANFNPAATMTAAMGAVTVGAGTVNFNSGESPAFTTLLQTGGAIGGADAIAFTGPATWRGGAMNGSGRTSFRGGATLGLATAAYDERLGGSRTLRFDSDAGVSSPATNFGLLVDSPDVRVEVAAGRTLTIDDNAQLYGTPATFVIEPGATLVHTGTAASVGGVSWHTQNAGTIRNTIGVLNFTNDNAFDGSLVADANTAIRFVYGTNSFAGSGGIRGGGTLEVLGGTAIVRDAFALATPIRLTGGTLTVDAYTATPALTITGGTLNGSGTLRVGTLDWRSATMGGTGKTIVTGTATIGSSTANYDEHLDGARTLRVEGYAQVNAPNNNWGLVAGSTGARIEIAPDAVLTLAGEAELYGTPATLAIESRGTLEHGGVGDALVTWDLANDGHVRVDGGSITLQRAIASTGTPAGDFAVRSGATLNFQQPVTTLVYGLAIDGNAVVNGIGSLVNNRGRIELTDGAGITITPAGGATFNNEGAINLSANSVLTVRGNARFAGPNASLRAELAGPTVFGRLAITGSLDLGAASTLSAWLADGYDPASGTRHDVLVANAGVSGAFAAFDADPTNGGLALIATRPANNVVAVDVAVAAPAPHVTSQAFDFETRQAIVLNFDANVGASIGRDDLIIRNLTTGQTLANTVGTLSYDTTTNRATLVLTGLLADGRYEVSLVAGGITNNAGVAVVTPAAPLTFNVLRGDINRDGAVNFDDLLVLAQNYGTTGRTFSTANIDYSPDGAVNFDDLLILAQQYGKSLASLQSAVQAATVKPRAPATRSGRSAGEVIA